MGCSSSTDAAPSSSSSRAVKPAAAPASRGGATATTPDLSTEARPLRDIRKDLERDPNALSHAPMPDAHVGLLDEGQSRGIDSWLDSMGMDPPRELGDPTFDINNDPGTPALTGAILRQHESSCAAGEDTAAALGDGDGDDDGKVSLKSGDGGGGVENANGAPIGGLPAGICGNPLALPPDEGKDSSHNASAMIPIEAAAT